MSRREELYKDFIVVAGEAYGNAVVSNEPQLPELVDLSHASCPFRERLPDLCIHVAHRRMWL
jgi:hypothetical protein